MYRITCIANEPLPLSTALKSSLQSKSDMLSLNMTLRTHSEPVFRSHEVTACTELHILLMNQFPYLYRAEIKSIGQVTPAEFEYNTQKTIQTHLQVISPIPLALYAYICQQQSPTTSLISMCSNSRVWANSYVRSPNLSLRTCYVIALYPHSSPGSLNVSSPFAVFLSAHQFQAKGDTLSYYLNEICSIYDEAHTEYHPERSC